MIHHMCGGLGAWLSATQFETNVDCNSAFAIMAVASAIGIVLTVVLASRKRSNLWEAQQQQPKSIRSRFHLNHPLVW